MPRTLLHIGLPKTGTTTLQENLFSRHPQIRYLGQTNIWRDPDARALLWFLLTGNDAEEAARISPAVDGLTTVVSDEALSMGEFMQRATRWPIDNDPATVAYRARRLLGEDVQVVIVLRNQADWLVSWHRQGLKTGKYTETDFRRWLDIELGEKRKARLFALLDYRRLYQAYVDVFGADHVHIYLYESYKDQFEHLAQRIVQVAEIDGIPAEDPPAESARNVTGAAYRATPATLRVAGRLPLLRNLWALMPKALRGQIRQRLTRTREYAPVDSDAHASLRGQFRQSNLELFDQLDMHVSHVDYD